MKNLVWVNYMDGEEAVTRKAQVLYWGHTYEYVSTPVTRLIDGYLVKDQSEMPLQIIAVVVRVLSTGEVMQVKPEAIHFDKVSEKL